VPGRKLIVLRNLGRGALPKARVDAGARWLAVGRGTEREALQVSVDAAGLAPGRYEATVSVDCPGAANSPQRFRVELDVRDAPPKDSATIDDRDEGFYATPYFWAGHRFCRCPKERRGHGGFYLTNGGRPAAGEFARFTPDLKAGTYDVALSEATPFRRGTAFDVRVRHRGGETTVRVRPGRSRRVGTFEFEEGTDGFVEVLAAGSKGLVVADAVVFEAR
jgi:hypothetical protein